MNRQLTRIIVGLVIIAVGVVALLNVLNIANFNDLRLDKWWPLIVVGAGILAFINHPRQYIWPLIIVGVGVLLQLRQLDIIMFNVWQLFWPIVIIGVGLSVIVNHTHAHRGVNKRDLDDVTAVLSGNTTKNESKDYQGGTISAVFGGAELDLRDAIIAKEATLNVNAFCGGITIHVPEGWHIISKVTPIGGGVENKTHTADKNAPTLVIVGDVVFGGVEIKH